MADVRISDATTATTGTVYVPGGAGGAPLKVATTAVGREVMGAASAAAARAALGLTGPATADPAALAADAWLAGKVHLASHYGATADGATDDRAALQEAIDAAEDDDGGAVLLDLAGTYRLTATGSGSDRVCLTLSGVSLLIPPWATIELADGQATPGNPVKVVRIPDGGSGVYLGWPDGPAGWIDGNTAGQTGWTGGFGQSNGYELVSAGTGVSYLTFDNLRLRNSFGNTLNVGGGSTYGTSHHVRLRNTYSENQGEGPQLICVDYFDWDGAECVGNGNMAGDYCELALCRYGHVRGVVSRTHDGASAAQGGSALDLYASRHVTADGVVGVGCQYGMQVETDFSNSQNYPDHNVVSNVSFKNINFAGLIATGGRLAVTNLTSVGQLGSSFQFSNTAHSSAGRAVYRLSNCRFEGAVPGYLTDNASLQAAGTALENTSGTTPLLNLGHTSGAASPRLLWDGGRLAGAAACNLSGTGTGPVGHVRGADLTDSTPNGSGINFAVAGGSACTYAGLELAVEWEATAGVASVVGASRWAGTGGPLGTSSFPVGSKNQLLRVTAYTGAPLTLTPGARLRLRDADTAYLSNTGDWLLLRYDAVNDRWEEQGRAVNLIGARMTVRGYRVASPAADTTYQLGGFLVPANCSLKQITSVCYSAGIGGSYTVRFRTGGAPGAGTIKTGTGASLTVTSANQYTGATTALSPNQVTFAAPLYVTAELVTDASFNPSGNGYIDTEIRMWE